MNSTLLLALNAVALAAVVMFQFQSVDTEDAAQISQAIPHHLQQQQRPQLAVLSANPEPIRRTEGAQTLPISEHWVF